MPTLSVTNKTSSRLPTNKFIGTLSPSELKTLDLTANELEMSKDVLVGLADAGLITWTVAGTASDADNAAEAVMGGSTVLSGSGVPAIVADVGSLYVDTAGGAGTTLYVKESGNGTSAGWVGK